MDCCRWSAWCPIRDETLQQWPYRIDNHLQYLCAVHVHVTELRWLRMPCCVNLRRQSVYAALGHLPFV